MEEGRGHLLHPAHLSNVPHVQAVVVVHTAEPATDRVVLEGDDVCVTSVCLGVEEMAAEREETKEHFVTRTDAIRDRKFYK